MGRTYGDRSDHSDKVLVLKKKVKFLEREVARLTKELNKAMQFVAEARNRLKEENIKHDESSPAKKRQSSHKCDNCGKGEYHALHLNIKGNPRTYFTCDTCGHRKVGK